MWGAGMVSIKKYLAWTVLIGLGFGSTGYYYTAFLNGASENATFGFRQANLALFKKMGLVYLKNIEFNVTRAPQYFDVKHSKRYIASPAYYDDLEKKYGSQIAQGYVAPLSVRFINDIIGYGIFAESDIDQDQMIGEYTGVVQESRDIKDSKYTWSYLSSNDEAGKQFNLSVDAAHFGNEMRFINHDYDPNAAMKYIPQGGFWHVVYIASKPIKKGEQLLINYGQGYWSGKRGAPHKLS
jgi:SET domain-containing protein